MSYTILHVDSSPAGERSVSRKVTARALAELKKQHPGAAVIERDLATQPLPHLDSLSIGAFFTPPANRNEALSEAVRLSDLLVDEVLAADAIVIGAPMHNFGIPSSLKAWIDHVVRAGRTFKYTENGPVGLVPANKKVIVALARGGVYSDERMKAFDYQETYLRTVLGFIGLTNISFVRAEGVAAGPDGALRAMQMAESQLADAVGVAA